ncbi:histidine phosphatase family protein [Deinococcus sonorensis]|uniref:Histidine phosphatase family protein n=2 Tax=Deinococcus sonorensis TaxID=309891 RepID=A0AAU7U8N8_9DEIO
MQRLILVRHGETLSVGPKRLRGQDSLPDPLSALGARQAAACGEALAALQLPEPRVYASSYLRAQQTAQLIGHALNVPVQVLDGLHELDPGHWTGRPQSDLQTLGHLLTRPDGSFGFPGGEDQAAAARRGQAALKAALAQGGTPVVVSHGLMIRVLLSELLGAGGPLCWGSGPYDHPAAAWSELSGQGGRWTAVRLRATAPVPQI